MFRRSSEGWQYAIYSGLPRTMVTIGSEPSSTLQVVRHDPSGNLSEPSEPLTVPGVPSSPPPSSPPPSSPPPTATCAVAYDAWNWKSGFTTRIVAKNTV
ncbi:hypothetical protein AAH991_22375 [Microbispora sp. ZYX-F-249]|uniref:Uncharacterized protein n=1 Tax=Microbispora maris TaxID=3144104 RepID=A0ABV0ARI0_9ACTN